MSKVLFLASNPEGTSKLALDEEIRSITQKIRASDYRDVLDIESLWAVRPDDLLQALNEHKPEIVHFSGHGKSSGEILLMDKNRRPMAVSDTALRMLFSTLKDDIRIVVLNACYSERQASAISEVIDCVVGMDKAVGDDAAITFAAAFYRAIGFGRTVQEAFDQGKTAILLEGIPESNTPSLLTRCGVDSNAIFLTDTGFEANAMVVAKDAPESILKLLSSGSEFIKVPPQSRDVTQNRPRDYIFCELRMRQSEAVFIFGANKRERVSYVAEYLAKTVFPHLSSDDYEWFLVKNSECLPDVSNKSVDCHHLSLLDYARLDAYPSNHSFMAAGIKSGDYMFLLGNHKLPTFYPAPDETP